MKLNKDKEFKFLFTFLIFSSIFYLVVSKFYSADTPIVGTFTITFILNNLLKISGIDSIQMGDTVYLPNNIKLRIITECTGLYEMIILCSMIISYPTNITNKLYGVITGIAMISTLNMIRLITISYILIYYNNMFYFVDIYLWQISLVIFISLTYIIWLKSIRQ